jgi:hypothetical protein
MMSKLRGLALAACVTASVFAYIGPADAATYEDIIGKWCGRGYEGNQVTLNFTRAYFTVAWPNLNTNAVTFQNQSYEFQPDGTITVHYRNAKDKTVRVIYGEFSARKMIQLPTTDGGGRYTFTRC